MITCRIATSAVTPTGPLDVAVGVLCDQVEAILGRVFAEELANVSCRLQAYSAQERHAETLHGYPMVVQVIVDADTIHGSLLHSGNVLRGELEALFDVEFVETVKFRIVIQPRGEIYNDR